MNASSSGGPGNNSGKPTPFSPQSLFSTAYSWLSLSSNCGRWIRDLFYQIDSTFGAERWDKLLAYAGQGALGQFDYIVEKNNQFYQGSADTYATEHDGTITLWKPFFQGNSTYQAQVLLHELIHKAGAGYFTDEVIAKKLGWRYDDSKPPDQNRDSASAYWNTHFLGVCK